MKSMLVDFLMYVVKIQNINKLYWNKPMYNYNQSRQKNQGRSKQLKTTENLGLSTCVYLLGTNFLSPLFMDVRDYTSSYNNDY